MKSYIESILKGILIGSIAVFIASNVQAKGLFTADDDPQAWCLAQNIYYETRGSSLADMAATADVVINRVNDTRYPNTICDVVQQGKKNSNGTMRRNMCQFSWYCDGRSDTPKDELAFERAIEQAAHGYYLHDIGYDVTEGATHYHSTSVDPAWNRAKHFTVSIDDHIFYRWD